MNSQREYINNIHTTSKREKWNKTIYAWFAKWLKGQSEWWSDLYPEKSL